MPPSDQSIAALRAQAATMTSAATAERRVRRGARPRAAAVTAIAQPASALRESVINTPAPAVIAIRGRTATGSRFMSNTIPRTIAAPHWFALAYRPDERVATGTRKYVG